MPLVETLDTYQPGIITRMYARNGAVLAEYAIQRRIVVPKKEIAPALINAIVATEDAGFYRHGGIDPKAILRALIKDAIARKKVEGASTLTQQLAKQVFLTPEKTWRRKINEMLLAVEVEKRLTKDQIFELYANQLYLGHGAYGVESASRLYFGKHAKDLTLPEAALIAAVIRRPSYYSPISNMDAAVGRRNYVIRRMLAEKYISRDEADRAISTPIVFGSYKEEAPKVGAYFSEQVRQHIEQHYGTEDLYRNGLKVYTTLDLALQKHAEDALKNGLRKIDRRRGYRKPARNLLKEGIELAAFKDPSWDDERVPNTLIAGVVTAVDANSVDVRIGDETLELGKSSWAWSRKTTLSGFLKTGDLISVRYDLDPKTQAKRWFIDQVPQVQGAIVALDVKSGEVRALVGGYDFAMSKFNRAVQSVRQTGSAFKPFVYGAAFENGYTPGDTIFDAPVAIPVGRATYSPRNYYGKYAGIVTIQRAVELSINVPAVKAYVMVGGQKVVDFAKRCGITSDLPRYPSLALGAGGVSPLEMTAAYNVFANQGVYTKPRLIRKITDSTDKVLEEGYPELSEATSAQNAYLMTYVMQGTIDRGTAFDARHLPGAFAGKTGTTNGYTDAWFVGYSPDIAVGVWVGYDDPRRSLGGGSTGADIALPIWIDFFKRLDIDKLRGEPKAEFEMPPGVVIVPMDLRSGRRGVGPCGRVVKEAFITGTEPNRDCSGSVVAVAKLPYYLQRPFYQPKETEPTVAATDVMAQTGEGGESPAPADSALPETAGESTPPQAPRADAPGEIPPPPG